jgi:hypothetical protein
MRTALARPPMSRADCPCLACSRLDSALAFHQAAIAIGYPALLVATRTVVRLIAAEVDRRHHLPGGGVMAFLDDADDGFLLAIPDPIRAGIELAGGPFV